MATMGAIVVALLVVFAVVEVAEVPIFTEPDDVLSGGGVLAAGLGVALLVSDVVLPVPSSVVMVAHGALFGVVAGTVLSMSGSVGAALVGVWLGRRGKRLLRLGEADHRDAQALVQRWGTVAVVATRPVPMLAEAVVVMAGAAGASPWRVAMAAAAGAAPAALLYGLVGSLALDAVSGGLVFAVVLIVAAVFWVVAARSVA